MQFEILVLITTVSLTIADVIIPSEYIQPHVQYQPIGRQSYLIPYRAYTQPEFTPVYLNKHQIVNPTVNQDRTFQESDISLHSIEKSEIAPHESLLRRMRVGAHEIVHPFRGVDKKLFTVHRRVKKSAGNEPDFGKTRETNAAQPNSSLNDQTMKNNENKNPNNIVIKDKETQTTETKNNPTTSGTLFDLNPKNLNSEFLISSNIQKINDPTNLHNSNTEPNLLNTQNIAIDKEISKIEDLPKKPMLRNFIDPRLIIPIKSNPQMQYRSKHDEVNDPLVKPLVQQIYPTLPSIYNYYQDPLHNNLVYSNKGYQPGVYTVYYSTDGSNKILTPETNTNEQCAEQSAQQQISQDGTHQVINIIPSSRYTYWPHSQYNYLSNYMLEYPKLSYNYPLPSYPSSYAPYIQNALL